MNGIVEGKVVVVTGAGRGIGRAIAIAMAQQRAKVVVNDIGVSLTGEGDDPKPAEEVVSEVRKLGGEAVASFDSVAGWDKNEIFLMSQSRPLRSVHRSEGWTPEACAEHMLPALKSAFYPPTERTADVFSWDSI